MTGLKIFLLITVSSFIVSSSYADIYEWTDAEGVRHFTNYAPPPEAGIMMKTNEVPYDEAADNARLEAEREVQLELDRREIAERTIALERREAEAEQRLTEADRKAEAAVREAERLLDEVRNNRYDSGDSGYPGYYPYRYNNGYYYRNQTGSIYFIKRPQVIPYNRNRHKNYRYGRNNGHVPGYGHKEAYPRNNYFGFNSGNHRSRLSLQSYSDSQNGRHQSGRVHSVSRSRRN